MTVTYAKWFCTNTKCKLYQENLLIDDLAYSYVVCGIECPSCYERLRYNPRTPSVEVSPLWEMVQFDR